MYLEDIFVLALFLVIHSSLTIIISPPSISHALSGGGGGLLHLTVFLADPFYTITAFSFTSLPCWRQHAGEAHIAAIRLWQDTARRTTPSIIIIIIWHCSAAALVVAPAQMSAEYERENSFSNHCVALAVATCLPQLASVTRCA